MESRLHAIRRAVAGVYKGTQKPRWFRWAEVANRGNSRKLRRPTAMETDVALRYTAKGFAADPVFSEPALPGRRLSLEGSTGSGR